MDLPYIYYLGLLGKKTVLKFFISDILSTFAPEFNKTKVSDASLNRKIIN